MQGALGPGVGARTGQHDAASRGCGREVVAPVGPATVGDGGQPADRRAFGVPQDRVLAQPRGKRLLSHAEHDEQVEVGTGDVTHGGDGDATTEGGAAGQRPVELAGHGLPHQVVRRSRIVDAVQPERGRRRPRARRRRRRVRRPPTGSLVALPAPAVDLPRSPEEPLDRPAQHRADLGPGRGAATASQVATTSSTKDPRARQSAILRSVDARRAASASWSVSAPAVRLALLAKVSSRSRQPRWERLTPASRESRSQRAVGTLWPAASKIGASVSQSSTSARA